MFKIKNSLTKKQLLHNLRCLPALKLTIPILALQFMDVVILVVFTITANYGFDNFIQLKEYVAL